MLKVICKLSCHFKITLDHQQMFYIQFWQTLSFPKAQLGWWNFTWYIKVSNFLTHRNTHALVCLSFHSQFGICLFTASNAVDRPTIPAPAAWKT